MDGGGLSLSLGPAVVVALLSTRGREFEIDSPEKSTLPCSIERGSRERGNARLPSSEEIGGERERESRERERDISERT